MNNWDRMADIGTTLGAALTRNPEVLARTQASNDAVKLRKFGRRIFMDGDPTRISEKEILEAASEYDVPPDQAVEFVGRFFEQRRRREESRREPMGVVSIPLGDGRFVKREVPQSQIPGLMQEHPEAVPGQVYGSRDPTPAGRGGLSPSQQMNAMKLEAWNRYMAGSANPREMEMIGVGGGSRGGELTPSQQLNAMKVAAWKRLYEGNETPQDRAIVNQDRDPYFSDAMRAILQSPAGWRLSPEEVIRRARQVAAEARGGGTIPGAEPPEGQEGAGADLMGQYMGTSGAGELGPEDRAMIEEMRRILSGG